MEYLRGHQEIPLSAEQIAAGIGDINPSTVYRNIAWLIDEGLVVKTLSADGHTALYQYHDRTVCCGHLHMRCQACGRLMHLDDRLSCEITRLLCSRGEFHLDAGNTVLLGQCRACTAEGGKRDA